MKRRDFITLLGGAVTWPVVARAQQPGRKLRIGVLIGYAEDDPETKARLSAFRQGLEKRGWSEGRNIQIETRSAAGSVDKYEPLAGRGKDCSASSSNPMMEGPWCRFR